MGKKLGLLCGLGVLLSSTILGGCDIMQTTAPLPKTDYPTRAINFIVPFSAGGGLDLQARTLEKLAPQYLNQALIVLNKTGGGGTLGWNELVNAAPDGYTLGISGQELFLHPLYGATKYHYPTALEPLAQLSAAPVLMVVNAEQPWQSVDEVIQYAKQHPGELKFGHGGIGALMHITGEVFAKLAGIQLEQVPFRGGSESTIALLGNHIQIVFANPATVKEQIRAGKLRALASTGEQRMLDADLAKIPTFKELGLDIVLTNWVGVAAPKTLPTAVKAKLEAALQAMILDPEFKVNVEAMGLQVEYLNAEDSQTRWLDDGKKLRKLVEELGIVDQVKARQQGN